MMPPTSPPPYAGGVKKQQSTSDGSVKVGRWTAGDDEQRVLRRMMRAATKRAREEMAMATVTRVAVERRRRG